MAKCSTKGCKKGATKRLVMADSMGNTKNRPICQECAEQQMTDPKFSDTGHIIDASSKHH